MRLMAAAQSVIDAAQLIGLGLMTTNTRPYWRTARQEMRALRFRSQARIQPMALAELVGRLSPEPPPAVVMPPATAQWAEVGSPAYFYTLGALCQALAPRSVLEIGTYLGFGTLTLALNTSRDCQIVTIDLPPQVAPQSMAGLRPDDQYLVHRSRSHVGEAFAGQPSAGRIRQVLADSTSIAFADYLPSADLVFIDGAHNYEAVKHDTTNALSILAAGGLIVWDDYGPVCPGVVRYLDELRSELPLVRIEGTNFAAYCQARGATQETHANP
jgi:predicted O-methyltransferase YrrM